ncbi:mechanosensitive ion channel family protein [Candidatus Bipolaricaulota bacterium]
MWYRISHWITSYGSQVLGAVVTLIVGYLLARFVKKLIGRLLGRTQTPPAVRNFTGQIAYVSILIVVVIAALARFGIQTTSIVAVFGAMSFAVGFALQGSLSNFASGVLLLILRPFKIGDVIEAGGVTGSVKDIQLFSTILATPDNVKVFVPNAQVYGGTIRNYAGYETRRIDIPVGIGYGDSLEQAFAVAQGVMTADERVLKDPAPEVLVGELGDSSVNLILRLWVRGNDYWYVLFDGIRGIKEAFDENGIDIPFPQQVVHVAKE